MSSIVRKMRAHRLVLEQNCSICNTGFNLAEEVYQCSVCGGYHHVACWDAKGTCAPATTPYASYPPPPPPPPATMPYTSYPTPPPPPPGAPPPPPSFIDANTKPLGGVDSADLQATYSTWSLEVLEDALTMARSSYQPAAISLMEAEVKRRGGSPFKVCSFCQNLSRAMVAFCTHCGNPFAPASAPPAFAPQAPAYAQPTSPIAQTATQFAPDERRCPTCAEVIKKEALKCRYCGHVLDFRYTPQASPGGGLFYDAGKRMTEDKIRSDAQSALTFSIIGIFCLQIILQPIAIFRASRVFSQISAAERAYGSIDVGTARGQALASVIIGVIMIVFFFIFVIAGIANSPPSRY